MKSISRSSVVIASACNVLGAAVIRTTAAALILTGSMFTEPVAQGDEIAVVASNLDRICKSHRPDCQCPSCRSFFDSCSPSCPPVASPPYLPPEPSTQPPAPSTEQGSESILGLSDDLLAAPSQPPPITGPVTSLASGLGAIPAAQSASPGMIGDLFYSSHFYGPATAMQGANVAVGGGDRILKISDNNNPLPQDRVFFNYHLFNNAGLDVNQEIQDINRFVFGIERTFWDDLISLEFRLPFTAGLDATQTRNVADTAGAEFGNLALAFKALVFERRNWSVGAGLAMIFPTADDAVLFANGDLQSVFTGDLQSVFTNESFYLQPFVGLNHRSENPLFFQFFAQANFDTSGSVFSVVDDDIFFGSSGTDRLFTQSLLFLDFSAGYWIYQSKCQSDCITGIAPMIELHYTTTMDDLDRPDFNNNYIEPNFRSDFLNITGGVLFNLGRSTSLRVAGVAPLRDGDDKLFDSELSAQLVWRY